MQLPRLHIFAICLLPPVCIFQAVAQAPAASTNFGNSSTTFSTLSPQDLSNRSTPITPSASSTLVLTSPKQTAPNPFEFRISKQNLHPLDLHSEDRSLEGEFQPQELAQLAVANNRNTLVARLTGPCYSMRVYGARSQGLPPPSIHTNRLHPSNIHTLEATPPSSHTQREVTLQLSQGNISINWLSA